MTLTITLPEEVDDRLRAAAEAEGMRPDEVISDFVARFLSAFGEAALVDAAVAAEIRVALDEARAEQARGGLMTVDEAFAELEARVERRRQAHAV